MTPPAVSTFAVSDAALEGFRVVKDHWRLVVGWGLFNLLALVGGCILLVILLFAVVPFVSSRDAAGSAGAALGGAVIGVGGLAVEVIVQTAIYRVMLRPEKSGFLQLHIGRDELRVLGAVLLVVLAAFPLLLGAGLVVALVGRVSGALATLAAGVLLLGAYVVLLRFSLTPVIAFAEGRIDIVAAWRRTRGQGWRLVGMGVLLFSVVVLIAVVAWIAVFLLGGTLTGFHDLGLNGAETAAQHPGRYILGLTLQMLLAPFFMVISQAPWVAVYRAVGAPP